MKKNIIFQVKSAIHLSNRCFCCHEGSLYTRTVSFLLVLIVLTRNWKMFWKWQSSCCTSFVYCHALVLMKPSFFVSSRPLNKKCTTLISFNSIGQSHSQLWFHCQSQSRLSRGRQHQNSSVSRWHCHKVGESVAILAQASYVWRPHWPQGPPRGTVAKM